MALPDRLVERVARGHINLLVLGETGAGKEVLAERIHRLSPRAARPLLRLHCAALPETLFESELFGHERGAFTGACQAKPGLLETAEGGTVFLDEVGEMPPAIQVKLLRVIEDRRVLRLGGVTQRPIDVRFIAATHRDVAAEVARGAFRQDLYFRLNGVSLVVPPLRERTGEIERLARRFLAEACRAAGQAEPELPPESVRALETYTWPGNVRELRNAMERALLFTTDRILPEHLPSGAASPAADPAAPAATDDLDAQWAEIERLRGQLALLERRRIETALRSCAGNQTRAARLLGIPRRTLVNRLAALGIERPRAA